MIEIITHVWAEKLPQYAKALRYQLASLLHHPCAIGVAISVVYTPSDKEVVSVMDEFERLAKTRPLHLYRLPLCLEDLGRRHYGRNLAASNTKAGLVWYADVDHYFGDGCLDTAWRIHQDKWQANYWVDGCWISKDHATGDQQLGIAATSIEECPSCAYLGEGGNWVRKDYNRGIGGSLLSSGAYAREHGYLRGGKWSPPWKDHREPFSSFGCDVAFKRQVREHGGSTSISLPNLFRLRHTECTYKGRSGDRV